MSKEHNQFFSTTGSSCNTSSLWATRSKYAGFCSNTGASINALANHQLDHNQFIQFLALPIAKDKKQIPHTETIRSPVIREADITTFIETFESPTSCTGMNLVTEDVITTLPKNWATITQVKIKMMRGYCWEDCEL